MASVALTYNGVTLSPDYTTLKGFSVEPVMTDDGADLLYTRYRMEIETVVSSTWTGPPVGNYLNNVRQALITKRAALKLVQDQTTWLDVPANGDAMNGPEVKNLAVKRLVGEHAYILSFTIETCVLPCLSMNSFPVISNRWSATAEMDSYFYWTRTISGRLVVGNRMWNPDSFRDLCIPPIPKGFHRERINCTVDSAGLQLQYTVIDRQRNKPVPAPLSNWEGTYSEPTNDGVTTMKHLHCKAWGAVGTAKQDLLIFLAKIVSSRFRFSGAVPRDVLRSASITESLNDNWVEMNVSALAVPGETVAGVPMTTKSVIGANIDVVDNATESDPGSRGTYLAELFVQGLKSPCEGTHAIFTADYYGVSGEDSKPGTSPGTEVQIQQGSLGNVEEGQTSYSEAHKSNPYTRVDTEVKYRYEQHKLHLPVAGGSGSTIVQVANPTVQKIVRYVATRVGEKPQLPDPSLSEGDFQLLDNEIIGAATRVAADGVTKEYAVQGQYIYGSTSLPSSGSLSLAALPIFQDTTIGSIDYYQFAYNLV